MQVFIGRGSCSPKMFAFEFFDHGANRDVFQGVSQVAGPLVLKLQLLRAGMDADGNSREMQLLQEGVHPFCVRVFGLFTKALGPHVYSCLVESMAEKTVNDALLASVGMPCTAASLEVALRTLWSVAYLMGALHRAGFNCMDAGPWNLGLDSGTSQRVLFGLGTRGKGPHETFQNKSSVER